jgi:hypothetical protein
VVAAAFVPSSGPNTLTACISSVWSSWESYCFCWQRKRCTSEFQRRYRSLALLPRLKAVGYRLFMLYAGPFVLEDNVDEHAYNHFLQLHYAMSILLWLSINGQQVEFARYQLRSFFQTLGELYRIELLIYNVHIPLFTYPTLATISSQFQTKA